MNEINAYINQRLNTGLDFSRRENLFVIWDNYFLPRDALLTYDTDEVCWIFSYLSALSKIINVAATEAHLAVIGAFLYATGYPANVDWFRVLP